MLKITAAVPTYNSEHFISRCLDSLVQQTMPNDEYEIICIDDCSQDGTVSILKKYGEQYPNIKVIEREKTRVDRENQEIRQFVRPAVNIYFLSILMIISELKPLKECISLQRFMIRTSCLGKWLV